MFITKKHLSRRTFLRGAGVTLALPMLDAMVPAQTAFAETAANPKPRFMGVFYPHGNAPGYWEPEKEGPLPEKLPYIMESLEQVKDQTVILSGLWSKSAEPPEGTTGSDHWVAAAFLTAIKPKKTAGRSTSTRMKSAKSSGGFSSPQKPQLRCRPWESLPAYRNNLTTTSSCSLILRRWLSGRT